MPDFTSRSSAKEMLDMDNVPFLDIKNNMAELEIINKYLGGHRINIMGIKSILHGKPTHACSADAPLLICEVGCGGGDNLNAIAVWCRQNQTPVKFIGIDINNECITYAKWHSEVTDSAEFITSDYKQVTFQRKPDIIFSSLLCHHLDEQELVSLLGWCRTNSTLGFFINDLHRHPLAFYSIAGLTKLFSKSYMIKNDAPLSVLKGFRKSEIIALLHKAMIKNFRVQWRWAFRWLVVYRQPQAIRQ